MSAKDLILTADWHGENNWKLNRSSRHNWNANPGLMERLVAKMKHILWSRIRNDLSSPVFCKNSLIVVDAFSKWLEITVRSSHHKYFRKYLNEGGIKQIASAPSHLSSSSQAERMVPTTKVSLSTVAQPHPDIIQEHADKNLEKVCTFQTDGQKIVNDEAESRIVYHYQFLAWPDHGVPPNPGTVVNFLEEINQLESGMTEKRPLIVHCSAGIGRTGTFIAIDLILCLIRKYGLQCTIDIRRTVQMLRSQRSGMVQTEAQYKFVYMSVHYYIDTFAKLLHEHKRIEDSGHEYTNIRYSAEVASNQVIPISPSPFGSSIRPCNHPQCEACSSTPVVYPPQLIPPPRPKKGPRNPRPENS
ncbi:Tyrosine-protein phosphatase corkscrew -like protein [Trichinella pseudospiralis]|uniref:Tyrosine-protein phosphatase corkscrew-like protein n=1 Tax=Trichinella pseudospiralis TaxID=6337 RepID=A0A0V1H5N3_TRIPS|nr:Tyrosine-protein phosphatase corkscrew -like protein [Trichinella pseudospiralis]